MNKYVRAGIYTYQDDKKFIQKPMVNIRVWKKFKTSQTVYPTEFGIALDEDEYMVLKVHFKHLFFI